MYINTLQIYRKQVSKHLGQYTERARDIVGIYLEIIYNMKSYKVRKDYEDNTRCVYRHGLIMKRIHVANTEHVSVMKKTHVEYTDMFA